MKVTALYNDRPTAHYEDVVSLTRTSDGVRVLGKRRFLARELAFYPDPLSPTVIGRVTFLVSP